MFSPMMLFDLRIRNLTDLTCEKRFKYCRDSSVNWLVDHGISAYVFSSSIVSVFHLCIHSSLLFNMSTVFLEIVAPMRAKMSKTLSNQMLIFALPFTLFA